MKTLFLTQKHFKNSETTMINSGKLSVSSFKYTTGVCGIRLKNAKGYIEILPFQGQQIWKAVFGGRNLTMDSPIKEPVPGVDFLKTFGAYLVHCGARRIATGTPEDPHPLHGDLPNAHYNKAFILSGKDNIGKFIAIGGEYEYAEFFGDHYVASPLIKLYENSSMIEVSMNITNKNNTPMELMYLAHINYKPVDNGRIVYSTSYNNKNIRFRDSIPSHIKVSDANLNFMKELKENPSVHHVLKPGMAYDPEGVFYISYQKDKNGFSHTMQIHPDGTSDYVRHNTKELPKALRWITRSPNHDAIALIEPSTAEADGYFAEKKKGNIIVLKGNETYSCNIHMGMLDKKETAKMEAFIIENFHSHL